MAERIFWVAVVAHDALVTDSSQIVGKVTLDMNKNPDGDDFREAIKEKFKPMFDGCASAALSVKTHDGEIISAQTKISSLLQLHAASSCVETSWRVSVPVNFSNSLYIIYKYKFSLFQTIRGNTSDQNIYSFKDFFNQIRSYYFVLSVNEYIYIYSSFSTLLYKSPHPVEIF